MKSCWLRSFGQQTGVAVAARVAAQRDEVAAVVLRNDGSGAVEVPPGVQLKAEAGVAVLAIGVHRNLAHQNRFEAAKASRWKVAKAEVDVSGAVGIAAV